MSFDERLLWGNSVSFASDNSDKRVVAQRWARLAGKTLTRADLRNAVCAALPQLSRTAASSLIDEVFEEIGHALLRGEEVKLSGFGVFRVREKKARPGRNPKTLEEAIVTARRVLTFSASPACRAMVNGEIIVDEED